MRWLLGCALVVANLAKVDKASQPIYVLGSGADFHGPSYQHPPAWDLAGRRGDHVNGQVGARAADRAFSHAGLRRDEVGVLELYDPFSFEIIRQLEAFGFLKNRLQTCLVRNGRSLAPFSFDR